MTIEVEIIRRNYDWLARVRSQPRCFELGRSPDEAFGRLVWLHAELFQIKVVVPLPKDYKRPRK